IVWRGLGESLAMLLNRNWFESGDWTRQELEVMDAQFVAAVEAAFQAGLESRAAARATVRIGKPSLVQLEAAIEAAWLWLWEKDGELPFAAIVARVRTQCPNVTVAVVRAGFERRFKARRLSDEIGRA